MDRVEFREVDERSVIEGRILRTIHPVVNGVLLRDLAKAVERPLAQRDGEEQLAGDYIGLLDSVLLRWPAKHYYGEPSEEWLFDGHTVLLGCRCGDTACWPLTADVKLTLDSVQWDGFHNSHRAWNHSGLGPFTFRTRQYLDALMATTGA